MRSNKPHKNNDKMINKAIKQLMNVNSKVDWTHLKKTIFWLGIIIFSPLVTEFETFLIGVKKPVLETNSAIICKVCDSEEATIELLHMVQDINTREKAERTDFKATMCMVFVLISNKNTLKLLSQGIKTVRFLSCSDWFNDGKEKPFENDVRKKPWEELWDYK